MNGVTVSTTVNGDAVQFVCPPSESLLDVLRNRLNLTGVKEKKHDFLYVDVNKGFDKMFHRNFNQLDFSDTQLDYADVMT